MTTPAALPHLVPPSNKYPHSPSPYNDSGNGYHIIPDDDLYSTHRYNLRACHVIALAILLQCPPIYQMVPTIHTANYASTSHASAVIDPITGNSLECRHLSIGPGAATWIKALANDIGLLA